MDAPLDLAAIARATVADAALATGPDSPDGIAAPVIARLVADDGRAAALALLQQLRPHLTVAMVAERVAEQQAAGYELHGAFAGDRLVAVAGGSMRTSLSQGRHYHLDDLMVAEEGRNRSVGRTLLTFVEQSARDRGSLSFHLAARPSAIGFYEKLGYTFATSPLMLKRSG